MTTPTQGRYAAINGLNLYYEIHGEGFPLVLIHGGGSTIYTSFGRILPELAKKHQVIAVEMQAHGHTADIDRPLSFEQDADDVAALLQLLEIRQADILGFSNGGTTALQLAIRYPQLVRKLVPVAATFQRKGMMPGLFEGIQHASIEHMPAVLKEAYLAVNSDEKRLLTMFHRDVARMVGFTDIPEELIKGIQCPVLVINNDKDVVLPEHALHLSRLIPDAQLVVLPGVHGACIGEAAAPEPDSKIPFMVAEMISEFLLKGSV